ncbi:hypothetical protein C3941_13125 [Kaistia algarum]|uniref:DUF2628 domain-containing protein n=1 Tax=Kaistia algarum TaxID=2083279 RepID=UPI000CE8525B|nr:DUF2628 domain-containing protein [Kaistia algarum]MCX5513843.1 DUF2628 domain-containing protein [Kaistia algarum]PPE79297.1 hypothetical protein C3941_13125 [Kaistia algarum]
MTIYTVHVPPARDRRAGRDAFRAVFVKEGFCWPGLVVAFPWLVFRRMWIVLAFYIIAGAGIIALSRQEELILVAMAVGAFVPLLLGFEGNDLRRWQLGLRGYEMMAVVEAASRAEAEIRYFSGRPEPVAKEPPPVPLLRPQPIAPSRGVVGFFPASGGAS